MEIKKLVITWEKNSNFEMHKLPIPIDHQKSLQILINVNSASFMLAFTNLSNKPFTLYKHVCMYILLKSCSSTLFTTPTCSVLFDLYWKM